MIDVDAVTRFQAKRKRSRECKKTCGFFLRSKAMFGRCGNLSKNL
jgi:hypothetical protein